MNGDIRKSVDEVVNAVFDDHCNDDLTKEDIFVMIVNSATDYLVHKDLFDDGSLSDDNELAINLMTKVINAVEDIINKSSLPTDVITAYGAKAIRGIANMRDI